MYGPYKFTDQKRARFLGALRQGMRRGEAARAAGVTRQATAWFAKQDPTFAQEIEQAELDACDIVESALFQKAVSGNTTAIIFYLTNRSPDRWKDRRTPVQIVQQAPPESLDELKKKLAEALEANE